MGAMRRRLFSAVIAIVVTAASASLAGIDDGNSLYRYCSATLGAFVMYCYGYVDSVVNDMRLYGSVAGYSACLPSVFDDSQRRDIIVAFLERYPQDRRVGATELTARAFAEAFPCPSKQSR